MIHILCANPALDRTIYVQAFYPNGVTRSSASHEGLGGKGFNVALPFIVTNEQKTIHMHTFFGGPVGEQLAQMMKNAQLAGETTFIEGDNRYCTILVNESKQEAALINEQGPSITEKEQQQFLQSLFCSLKAGDYLVLSGSLPKGTPLTFYRDIIAQAESRGVQTILDSSGDALAYGAEAKPWLIKINGEEFLDLMGVKEEAANRQQQIEESLKNSPYPNCIVTLGGEGTVAKINGDIWRVTLPTINVTNATASGDIFLGTFIREWRKTNDVKAALLAGSALSLANCLHWLPTIDFSQAEQYQQKIHIERVGSAV
jgi:tagatose 6-phosphate kinase